MADQAVVTDVWRAIAARAYSQDVVETFREIVSFKIGEGGYDPASWPHTPIAPDPTRLDVAGEGEALAGGGTCEFRNGNATVLGAGTTFLADVTAGQWVKPGALPHVNPYSAGTPGSEEDAWGQVLHVVDDTTLTLTAVYAGADHLFAEARACHVASEPLFVFRKALLAADVTFSAPASVRIDYELLAGEGNADQLGLSPQYFELAAFDSDGCMVVYATLDERLKLPVVLQLATMTTF